MAGKKVFLCFAAEDQYRVPPLLAAFSAWGISPDVFVPEVQPSGELLPETMEQIRECEVYLRLCTGMTRESPQVAIADATFRRLLEADHRRGTPEKRNLVNVILDSAYVPDGQDKATLYIDSAGKTRQLWFEELAVPLGVATLEQRVSRRALLGMGVGAALTVISGGVAADTFIQQQRQLQAETLILPNTRNFSGQARWTIPLAAFSDQNDVTTSLFNDNGAYYATAYALDGLPGVYALSPSNQTARMIPLALTAVETSDPNSSLSVAGGLVFFGYDEPIDRFHPAAYHVSDGALAFHLDVPSYYAPPTVSGESFYCLAVSTTGDLFVGAFDRRSGASRWQHPIADQPLDTVGNPAQITVAGGSVYVCAFDHSLTCYDATTGTVKWQFLARGQMTAPVVMNGVVYAGAGDGSIYALAEATGAVHWHITTPAGIVAPPAVSDGVVYIGSLEGFIRALDANTGALFWESLLGNLETNLLPYSIAGAPALYRNVISVASNGVVFAYDLRDGSFRWQFQPILQSTYPTSSPMIYQGLILFGSPDGKVYAVNP